MSQLQSCKIFGVISLLLNILLFGLQLSQEISLLLQRWCIAANRILALIMDIKSAILSFYDHQSPVNVRTIILFVCRPSRSLILILISPLMLLVWSAWEESNLHISASKAAASAIWLHADFGWGLESQTLNINVLNVLHLPGPPIPKIFLRSNTILPVVF